MKYGIDIGHNCFPDIGAVGIKKEDDLNKEVGIKVINKLRALGNIVINCTPVSAKNVSDSLYKRVETANKSNVDIYVSIHFNAGGGKGTEALYVSKESRVLAERIVNRISNLGYINRGLKYGGDLYVLKGTNAIAILIECCFIDSKEDMAKFNSDKIASAIVLGLTEGEPEKGNLNNGGKYNSIEIPSKQVLELQKALNRFKVTDGRGNLLIEDGIMGINTKASLSRFQSTIGIAADGNFNDETSNAIKLLLSKPIIKLKSKEIIAVKYIQWKVKTVIDGIFGIQTQSAVIKYQSQHGLAPDGVVGYFTWTKLIG